MSCSLMTGMCRTKGDAMKQHEHHQMLLRDADNKGDKQAEIERLNRYASSHPQLSIMSAVQFPVHTPCSSDM